MATASVQDFLDQANKSNKSSPLEKCFDKSMRMLKAYVDWSQPEGPMTILSDLWSSPLKDKGTSHHQEAKKLYHTLNDLIKTQNLNAEDKNKAMLKGIKNIVEAHPPTPKGSFENLCVAIALNVKELEKSKRQTQHHTHPSPSPSPKR